MEEVDHLAHERNKAQFDVEAMKIVWASSRHAFEVSDQMSRLVASDPIFCEGKIQLGGAKIMLRYIARGRAAAVGNKKPTAAAEAKHRRALGDIGNLVNFPILRSLMWCTWVHILMMHRLIW